MINLFRKCLKVSVLEYLAIRYANLYEMPTLHETEHTCYDQKCLPFIKWSTHAIPKCTELSRSPIARLRYSVCLCIMMQASSWLLAALQTKARTDSIHHLCPPNITLSVS